MSIQIQKQALEAMRKAEQMHKAMHVKAQETIELMQNVKSDALKRHRQYRKMVEAMEGGRIKEAKQLMEEMQTWKKYKLK